MKFHEIIPGLIAGKKYRRQDWKDATRHIYADVQDYGGYDIYYDGINVGAIAIGNWLTSGYDEWEEYKEYPKNLDFVEACRLAREDGAIISPEGSDCFDNYDWYDGTLGEFYSGDPFYPDNCVLQKWRVVGYKGEM